jgi:hypothetical protein
MISAVHFKPTVFQAGQHLNLHDVPKSAASSLHTPVSGLIRLIATRQDADCWC